MRAHSIGALLLAAALAASSGACRKTPDEPLKLERNVLTVDNRSDQDWNGVEVWLNTYYRVTTPTVRAGSRFQAPLDTFVAGFGQRFDFHRAQIRDLRLKATLPDGKPLEIRKAFDEHGIERALGGGKR